MGVADIAASQKKRQVQVRKHAIGRSVPLFTSSSSSSSDEDSPGIPSGDIEFPPELMEHYYLRDPSGETGSRVELCITDTQRVSIPVLPTPRSSLRPSSSIATTTHNMELEWDPTSSRASVSQPSRYRPQGPAVPGSPGAISAVSSRRSSRVPPPSGYGPHSYVQLGCEASLDSMGTSASGRHLYSTSRRMHSPERISPRISTAPAPFQRHRHPQPQPCPYPQPQPCPYPQPQPCPYPQPQLYSHPYPHPYHYHYPQPQPQPQTGPRCGSDIDPGTAPLSSSPSSWRTFASGIAQGPYAAHLTGPRACFTPTEPQHQSDMQQELRHMSGRAKGVEGVPLAGGGGGSNRDLFLAYEGQQQLLLNLRRRRQQQGRATPSTGSHTGLWGTGKTPLPPTMPAKWEQQLQRQVQPQHCSAAPNGSLQNDVRCAGDGRNKGDVVLHGLGSQAKRQHSHLSPAMQQQEEPPGNSLPKPNKVTHTRGSCDAGDGCDGSSGGDGLISNPDGSQSGSTFLSFVSSPVSGNPPDRTDRPHYSSASSRMQAPSSPNHADLPGDTAADQVLDARGLAGWGLSAQPPAAAASGRSSGSGQRPATDLSTVGAVGPTSGLARTGGRGWVVPCGAVLDTDRSSAWGQGCSATVTLVLNGAEISSRGSECGSFREAAGEEQRSVSTQQPAEYPALLKTQEAVRSGGRDEGEGHADRLGQCGGPCISLTANSLFRDTGGQDGDEQLRPGPNTALKIRCESGDEGVAASVEEAAESGRRGRFKPGARPPMLLLLGAVQHRISCGVDSSLATGDLPEVPAHFLNGTANPQHGSSQHQQGKATPQHRKTPSATNSEDGATDVFSLPMPSTVSCCLMHGAPPPTSQSNISRDGSRQLSSSSSPNHLHPGGERTGEGHLQRRMSTCGSRSEPSEDCSASAACASARYSLSAEDVHVLDLTCLQHQKQKQEEQQQKGRGSARRHRAVHNSPTAPLPVGPDATPSTLPEVLSVDGKGTSNGVISTSIKVDSVVSSGETLAELPSFAVCLAPGKVDDIMDGNHILCESTVAVAVAAAAASDDCNDPAAVTTAQHPLSFPVGLSTASSLTDAQDIAVAPEHAAADNKAPTNSTPYADDCGFDVKGLQRPLTTIPVADTGPQDAAEVDDLVDRPTDRPTERPSDRSLSRDRVPFLLKASPGASHSVSTEAEAQQDVLHPEPGPGWAAVALAAIMPPPPLSSSATDPAIDPPEAQEPASVVIVGSVPIELAATGGDEDARSSTPCVAALSSELLRHGIESIDRAPEGPATGGMDSLMAVASKLMKEEGSLGDVPHALTRVASYPHPSMETGGEPASSTSPVHEMPQAGVPRHCGGQGAWPHATGMAESQPPDVSSPEAAELAAGTETYGDKIGLKLETGEDGISQSRSLELPLAPPVSAPAPQHVRLGCEEDGGVGDGGGGVPAVHGVEGTVTTMGTSGQSPATMFLRGRLYAEVVASSPTIRSLATATSDASEHVAASGLRPGAERSGASLSAVILQPLKHQSSQERNGAVGNAPSSRHAARGAAMAEAAPLRSTCPRSCTKAKARRATTSTTSTTTSTAVASTMVQAETAATVATAAAVAATAPEAIIEAGTQDCCWSMVSRRGQRSRSNCMERNQGSHVISMDLDPYSLPVAAPGDVHSHSICKASHGVLESISSNGIDFNGEPGKGKQKPRTHDTKSATSELVHSPGRPGWKGARQRRTLEGHHTAAPKLKFDAPACNGDVDSNRAAMMALAGIAAIQDGKPDRGRGWLTFGAGILVSALLAGASALVLSMAELQPRPEAFPHRPVQLQKQEELVARPPPPKAAQQPAHMLQAAAGHGRVEVQGAGANAPPATGHGGIGPAEALASHPQYAGSVLPNGLDRNPQIFSAELEGWLAEGMEPPGTPTPAEHQEEVDLAAERLVKDRGSLDLDSCSRVLHNMCPAVTEHLETQATSTVVANAGLSPRAEHHLPISLSNEGCMSLDSKDHQKEVACFSAQPGFGNVHLDVAVEECWAQPGCGDASNVASDVPNSAGAPGCTAASGGVTASSITGSPLSLSTTSNARLPGLCLLATLAASIAALFHFTRRRLQNLRNRPMASCTLAGDTSSMPVTDKKQSPVSFAISSARFILQPQGWVRSDQRGYFARGTSRRTVQQPHGGGDPYGYSAAMLASVNEGDAIVEALVPAGSIAFLPAGLDCRKGTKEAHGPAYGGINGVRHHQQQDHHRQQQHHQQPKNYDEAGSPCHSNGNVDSNAGLLNPDYMRSNRMVRKGSMRNEKSADGPSGDLACGSDSGGGSAGGGPIAYRPEMCSQKPTWQQQQDVGNPWLRNRAVLLFDEQQMPSEGRGL